MTEARPLDAEESAGWLSQRERGAVWAIRLTAFLVTLVGRRASRGLVRGIAAYYFLFDRSVREASRDWLARVHGRPPRRREIYHHVFCFAQVTLDRLLFARGAIDSLVITRTGRGYLEDLTERKQGAILLGAHLGSFEAMRAASRTERFPVYIVGHFENARMINALLEKLDPDMAGRVVHAGGDPIQLALTLRDRIAEGNFVAILADRVGLNDKIVTVDFFGEPAPFATGPFLLAAALKCPIYLAFGLYREPNRYDLVCEPFADRVILPRSDREGALREVVARFASRLEAYCRQAPDNWFNFFEFWERRDR